jgi:predicted dehydrogenase
MQTPSAFSRRRFLQTASALAAGPLILQSTGYAASSRRLGPNDKIVLGFVGMGKLGTGSHLNAFLKRDDVQVVAVCDVDTTRRENAKKIATDHYAKQAKGGTFTGVEGYNDFRELVARKDIDAVVIATPDHWHALIAVAAADAGKDVYCEKPMAQSILEARSMVNAVRRNKRVFQTGSQQRSDAKFRRACEYVRSGAIGQVRTIKVGLPSVNWIANGKPPRVPDSAAPPELDYDMWLGPAPLRPYNEYHVHYFFRFFWDYSGGQMTNWGAHHLDIAQWGLGQDESGPVEIEGSAEYNPEKLYETPTKFDVRYKYADGTVLLCSSGTGKYRGGTLFEGGKGSIYVNRGALESTPEEILEEPLGSKRVKLYESADHYRNWLDCIKTRQDPICKVEIGHRSATMCHLGNIAVRSGKKVVWDPAKQQIVGDAELAKWASRPYRAPWKLPAA